jgi:hypothetical protein
MEIFDVPFDIALVELSERRFGYELERRSHSDSCSFTQRSTYVLSLSGQFRYVDIQASKKIPKISDSISYGSSIRANFREYSEAGR